jgi:hypothetical protein
MTHDVFLPTKKESEAKAVAIKRKIWITSNFIQCGKRDLPRDPEVKG